MQRLVNEGMLDGSRALELFTKLDSDTPDLEFLL